MAPPPRAVTMLSSRMPKMSSRFSMASRAPERAKAMEMDLVILGRCDELWVFGREWSEGMKAEIEVASRLGMKIRRFTEECREVQIDE